MAIIPKNRERRQTALEAEAKTKKSLQLDNEPSFEVDNEDDGNQSDEIVEVEDNEGKNDGNASKEIRIHPCGIILPKLAIIIENHTGHYEVVAVGSNVSIHNQREILELINIVGKLQVFMESMVGGVGRK